MNRKQARDRLLQERAATGKEARDRLDEALMGHFSALLQYIHGRHIGCYWPIRGEFNSVPLMMSLHKSGSSVSLPMVDDENKQLVFCKWHPEALMARDKVGVPYPADTEYEQPEILLIPLVGFDAQGYRLGYGAGYYDRTLHHMKPPPIAIGIGYEAGLLESINPHEMDVPMEFILTERGLRHFRAGRMEWVESGERAASIMRDLYFFHFRSREGITLSSPVCYADWVD
ncbi:5-formyltetrahydrofolate cyclo-ligase [Methylobacillus sp.]|uniref:5-formyltetrahydrofolate cyclo-ligase n=1 Tax=Methylobacillus sp. TaxID=56818 RepID=UPI002FE1615D